MGRGGSRNGAGTRVAARPASVGRTYRAPRFAASKGRAGTVSSATTASAIPLAEYRQRRERVLKSLSGSAAIVLSGDKHDHGVSFWRPDLDFYYLTGIADEPGAAVLFNPSAEDPRARITLLLRPLNPEMDRWEGLRDMVSKSLKARYGFETIRRTNQQGMLLTNAARRTKKLACLHAFGAGSVSGDLKLFRQVGERVPGVAIEDRTQMLAQMRAVKSAAELGLMRKAAGATANGYSEALRMIRPGVLESDVQMALERGYIEAGADRSSPGGVAYNSIVGSGLNATVLHYNANSARMEAGELLLIDSGAQVGGYACDVTRTVPVSGKFTSEQAELYSLVLEAQLAAIKVVKPGAYMHEVDEAARAVFEKAGDDRVDYYIHGIGHQLGLSVHDPMVDGPLKAGMIVTIEPGLYMPEIRTGIRIEDDILVTNRAGGENLTSAIPKTIREIEGAMRRG